MAKKLRSNERHEIKCFRHGASSFMSDPIKCNLTANVALRVSCERLLKEERVSVRSYGCSCVWVCVCGCVKLSFSDLSLRLAALTQEQILIKKSSGQTFC